MAFAVLKNQIK